jgi:ribosomal peptide maturation radical SAM protein 1
MSKKHLLLVAAPWADYISPSFQIGSLAAYVRREGFDVDTRHLYIEIASKFSLLKYDKIMTHHSMGEAISAALLFPHKRTQLLHHAEKNLPKAGRYASLFEKILRESSQHIAWNDYQMIGFTVNYQQLFTSLLLAKWIKQVYPSIKIALGGIIASGELGKSTLEHFPQIDWCISGEGELSLTSILRDLTKLDHVKETQISGLIYRTADGVKINKIHQLPALTSLPDPDYDQYFAFRNSHPALTHQSIPTYMPIEVARGCPYRCAFCSDHQFFKGFRTRPFSEIAASIDRLCRRHMIPSIFLVAQTITHEICSGLFPLLTSHGNDYRFFCEIRADLSKQDLQILKEAGTTRVQIGIETFSTSLLKKMRKGTRCIDNLKIMKYCEEVGIEVSAYFLIGFPTESQTDIEQNTKIIDYAEAFMPPFRFVEFMLQDGSPVYDNPKIYNISKIEEAAGFGRHLPREMHGIKLWYKDYKSAPRKRRYSKLIKRHADWCKRYEESRNAQRPMLFYLDLGTHLQIEDSRAYNTTITLEGWMRDLYVYCDSIATFDEITAHLKSVDPVEIMDVLNELCCLKVMFHEANSYLSLAINMSPARRRYLPFQ